MAVALFLPAAHIIYFSFVTNINTVTQDTVQYKAPGMCQSFACLERTLCRCTSINTLVLHPSLVLHLSVLTPLANLHHFLICTLSFLVCPLASCILLS